jgi:hypothetical protein
MCHSGWRWRWEDSSSAGQLLRADICQLTGQQLKRWQGTVSEYGALARSKRKWQRLEKIT